MAWCGLKCCETQVEISLASDHLAVQSCLFIRKHSSPWALLLPLAFVFSLCLFIGGRVLCLRQLSHWCWFIRQHMLLHADKERTLGWDWMGTPCLIYRGNAEFHVPCLSPQIAICACPDRRQICFIAFFCWDEEGNNQIPAKKAINEA